MCVEVRFVWPYKCVLKLDFLIIHSLFSKCFYFSPDHKSVCARKVSTVVCAHAPECHPGNCSNHGDCINGDCHCHGNWHGAACDSLKCGSHNCSGHGVCTAGKSLRFLGLNYQFENSLFFFFLHISTSVLKIIEKNNLILLDMNPYLNYWKN